MADRAGQFLNSAADVRWLKETHLRGKSYPPFKSFVLYGNEDWPDKVILYGKRVPMVSTPPIATLTDFGDTETNPRGKRQDPRATRLVFGDVAAWTVAANIAPGDRIAFQAYAGRGRSGPEYKERIGTVHLVGPHGPVVSLPGDRYGARPVVVTQDKFLRVVSRKNPRRGNRVTARARRAGLARAGQRLTMLTRLGRPMRKAAARRARRNPGALKVGQRVTALVYGEPKIGTVTRIGESLEGTRRHGIVWVRWDKTRRETWMHTTSVTPIGATTMRRNARGNPHMGGMQVLAPNMAELQHGVVKALYSYSTPVALTAKSGLYRTDKQWSNTTSRHISKWFAMMGLDAKGAKRIPQELVEYAIENGMDPADVKAPAKIFGKNPVLALVGANPRGGRYLGDVRRLFYLRKIGAHRNQRFQHAFKTLAKMYAMPDGSIRIVG